MPRSAVSVAKVGSQTRARQVTTFNFAFMAVLAYFFVDFGRPQDWIPILRSVHLGIFALGSGILALILYPPSTIPKSAKYVFAYLVLMAIGVPLAYNNYMAFIATKNFALFFFGAVLPIMVFVNSYQRMAFLFRYWIVIHIPLAVFSLLHKGYGVGSFLGDQNDFCLVMNMILPYAFFSLFVARSGLEKLFLTGSIGFFISAVVATLSRGGFLGFLSVGFFSWLHIPRKLTAAILIIIISGLFLLATPPSYWKEMQTIETADQEGDTGYGRLYLWGIAWRMFLDHPIIGVGPDNYMVQNQFYESEHEEDKGNHTWGRVAHSLYFTLLPEEGITGILIFSLIAISSWRDRAGIRRSYREILKREGVSSSKQEELGRIYYMTLAIDTSLVGFLVTGAFITVLYYPHFWILIALSTAIKQIFDSTVEEITSSPPETSLINRGLSTRKTGNIPAVQEG